MCSSWSRELQVVMHGESLLTKEVMCAISLPCKNLFYFNVPNTIDVYGKLYLFDVKYSKNAENFIRMWPIIQKGMSWLFQGRK